MPVQDFNLLRDFFGPIILIMILLVGFGVMSGANVKTLLSTFLDLVFSLIKLAITFAVQVLIPLLTMALNWLKWGIHALTGEAIKYLENKNKKQIENAADPSTSSTASAPGAGGAQGPEPAGPPPQPSPQPPPADQTSNPVVSGIYGMHKTTAPKTPSANPYDDPPDIEIIES